MVGQALALGQALAFLIAVTAACSTALAQAGLSFPTLQSSLNYLLLAAVYGTIHSRSGNRGGRWLSQPWWQYALLAALDVEANWLVVTAYRCTSMTSVTLLDCWAIPVTLALTRIQFRTAYRSGHLGGAALCILGLAVLVATDQRSSGGGGAAGGVPTGLLGDALVLLGASLYAVSNVLQEHLLGEVAVAELLAGLGAFGCLWSALQGAVLELPAALAAPWTAAAALPFVGFGAAMFGFYSGVPYELQWGGAALLNLSLLSADVWTALARLLLFGGFSAWGAAAFAASFAIVASGIALYSLAGDAKAVQEAVPMPLYMLVNSENGDGHRGAGAKEPQLWPGPTGREQQQSSTELRVVAEREGG